ncbi:lactose-binding lectin l-2 [Pleuronectes platessa]|uniref:lactose-binding lectin l-2 n=1 Tax=Pleuronectes platessa TaxID=8262 RepID=UPI00232A61A5|nr:lactose-binding lectin l-2 [Pleuronectes platessa]
MILLLLLFSLTLGAVSPSDGPEVKLQRGNCPMFWFSFNNRCYKYVETLMTWADAEVNCLSQGANLVSIRSLVEDTFLQFLIMNFDHVYGRAWIGLSDLAKEGIFMWSDGCAAKCYRWSIEEPNNLHGNEDCVEKSHRPYTKWKWNDLPCNVLIPSVCASRIMCPQ